MQATMAIVCSFLQNELFRGLRFVQDTEQDQIDHYKDLQDLYRTKSNDTNRPSLKGKHGKSSERDQQKYSCFLLAVSTYIIFKFSFKFC